MTADAVGGVWSYALDLCSALAGVRFIVATLGPQPGTTQRAAVARLANVSLIESDLRLEWMAGGQGDVAASRDWLMSLARQHDVDLIHVNGYAQVPLAGMLPTIAVAHSDVLSWWNAVYGEAAPDDWNDYRCAVTAGLRRASRVVALTAAGCDDLQRHYGFPRQRVTVIPNGIVDAVSPVLVKRSVVFAAGRVWDAAKNLRLLYEIAPDLPWPVEIAGDTMHPEHGLAVLNRAQALGSLDRAMLRRRLASAAIYAAPARYEPFGLGILEAASAGCALLLSDIPSLRENWDGAAILLPPDEPRRWREAIRRLIDNDAERDRLQRAARTRARHFPLALMAARYRTLYQELIGAAVSYEGVA